MTAPAWLTIAEASDLLRKRELSSVELTQALIERTQQIDPQFNAYLRFTPDIALKDARAADAELAAGKWRGPLHGVPYGLKDIVDYAGLPTTAHSKILADNLAKEDAEVARRLRDAGGVFMGKLSTHEFAIGGPSFDLPWPPARNPWNRDHFCGGSSSGSGAATAAGLLPGAIGTDTGGSVRNPASMCGVVGMKPTYGLVSRRGVVPLAFSLDHVGPLTRTVRDNAILLNLIAGHDAGDPACARRTAEDYTRDLDAGVKGLRVGIIRHFYQKDQVADPEMAASIESAAQTLAGLGAQVKEVATASLGEYAACNRTILVCEAFAIHERWMRERPQDYGALARERLMSGAFVRGADYVNATRLRRQLADAFHALFNDIDVVITASSMDPACRIDDPEQVEYTYARQARAPFNVTGSPAVSVPTGFSKSGLPLAMQIAGKPWSEALIYRVANAYEQATRWVDRHPTFA